MTTEPANRRPGGRRRPKVNWLLLLLVMSATWAGMAYLIYRIIASARW